MTTIPVVDVELELRSGGGTLPSPDRSQPERPSWRERRQRRSPRDRRMRRRGLLFVAPWLIGLSLFYVIPLAASLVLSFTDYQLVDQDDKPTEFIGLDNWTRLFEDPEVRHSAGVTLRFAVLFLPISIVLPLAFAYLLTSRHLWRSSVFRALFYLPAIVPFIAAAFIWQGYFNDTTGWMNRVLGLVRHRRSAVAGLVHVGHPGAGDHRHLGDRQRHHHLHGVAAQRAGRPVRGGPPRRRRRRGSCSATSRGR